VALLAMSFAILLSMNFLNTRGAPKLPPLSLFKVDHHRGCWFILTDDSCYTAYYYVGTGSMNDVSQALYTNLSKNPAYDVSPPEGGSIYVEYKHPTSKQEKNGDTFFAVELTEAPKSSDQYKGFFIPTEQCKFDATNCIEAMVTN